MLIWKKYVVCNSLEQVRNCQFIAWVLLGFSVWLTINDVTNLFSWMLAAKAAESLQKQYVGSSQALRVRASAKSSLSILSCSPYPSLWLVVPTAPPQWQASFACIDHSSYLSCYTSLFWVPVGTKIASHSRARYLKYYRKCRVKNA